MADSKFNWNDLMEGKTPTQEDIQSLQKNARERLTNARRAHDLAIQQLDLLQNLCRHPNKKGYICPDCGYDNSPDGY